MSATYETRVTTLTVMPKGEPTYSEMATVVAIDDEVGGEFVTVSQSGPEGPAKIAIDPSEWMELREAIDRMISQCRGAK